MRSLLGPAVKVMPRVKTVGKVLNFGGSMISFRRGTRLLGQVARGIGGIHEGKSGGTSTRLAFLVGDVPTRCVVRVLGGLAPSRLSGMAPCLSPRMCTRGSHLHVRVHSPGGVRKCGVPASREGGGANACGLFLFGSKRFGTISFACGSSFVICLVCLVSECGGRSRVSPVSLLRGG